MDGCARAKPTYKINYAGEMMTSSRSNQGTKITNIAVAPIQMVGFSTSKLSRRSIDLGGLQGGYEERGEEAYSITIVKIYLYSVCEN